jgi:hypothetical protein
MPTWARSRRGGYDDAPSPTGGQADSPRPQPRGKQIQRLSLAFSVSGLKEFREQLKVVAKALNIRANTDQERILAIVQYAYEGLRQEVVHEDNPAYGSQPVA